MDRRERLDDLRVVIRTALDAWQGQLWTALPAVVNSYDPAKMTVSAQPTIQARVLSPVGVWSGVTLPLCQDCPVAFPSGGGFSMTFPIAAGDEGILIFASRCIDAWWQNGGVQPQAELRMHDLSDGMFVPGIFSQPRKPVNVSATNVQMRSADGLTLVDMGPGIIQLVADQVVINGRNKVTVTTDNDNENIVMTSAGIAMKGAATITGTLGVSGALSAASAAIGGAINATSLVLTGALTAASAALSGALTAISAALTGALASASAAITNNLTAGGTITGTTDVKSGAHSLNNHVHVATIPAPGTYNTSGPVG